MVSGFPLWIHDTPGGRVVPSLVLTVPSSCDIPLDARPRGSSLVMVKKRLGGNDIGLL